MQRSVVALTDVYAGGVFDFAVPAFSFLRRDVVVTGNDEDGIETLNGIRPFLVAFDD